jgi:hypothetical protein
MSRQQDSYLTSRATGADMEAAAFEAGIPIAEARLIEADIKRGDLIIPAAGKAASSEGAPVMAEAEQDSVEVKKPDFEKAVRIFRGDIKPAIEAAGEKAQEASTAYKAIKNDCHVNTRAAKFVFQLAGESEEKRNDVLRSVRGLLNAMEIGITDDLVSDAEGEDTNDTIVPTASPERPELVTVQ